ncbi:MAG: hypothetical protein COA65_08650 [Rhodospirillaceae bacterium]|nr:MAG: hypothetical protein COA65_08650 [Rhodospirillaceae bacterium]
MKKPFKDTKFAKLLGGLVRESLQTVPVVGTIVTVFKKDTPKSPKGKINLQGWEWYRLVLGLGIGYALIKGLLTQEQITFILSFIGF